MIEIVFFLAVLCAALIRTLRESDSMCDASESLASHIESQYLKKCGGGADAQRWVIENNSWYVVENVEKLAVDL